MGVNQSAATSWSTSFKKESKKQIHDTFKKSVLVSGSRIMQSLQILSPVLTGAFRGHWMLSFNLADNSIQFDPSRTDKSSRTTFSVAIEKLNRYPKTFPNVVFFNPAPYGPFLEGPPGGSKQAPGGIIRPTKAKFRASGGS